MSSLPVYGYCMLVSASVIALLAMSTDFFVAHVNNILIPCQHDSVWVNNRCMCENTGGVFSGQYCDVCECEHLGICSIVQKNSDSRWGCRCPSHQKWVGTLCDKCYAKEHTPEKCRGDCIEDHFGPKCDKICLEDDRSTAGRCQEVKAGGGTCNACNGHGTCTERGECECDSGWFTSLGGEQCSKSCLDIGLTCPEHSGTCMSIGGKMQCVCKPNFFGRNCDKTCPGVGAPCSGHGSCEMDILENLVCTCEPHFIGEDCSLPCPGNNILPTACSGHGQCVPENGEAVCECSGPWEGFDCSCSPTYTCSGHGTCNQDATCQCFDDTQPEIHFGGVACERCQEHWFGQTCHLRCDPGGSYDPGPTDGLNIGCNGHGTCELVQEGSTEHITCVCLGTDPDTFCATCVPDYYPDVNLESMSIAPCSVECNPQTCSYNGVCNQNFNGTNNLCICDTWINQAGVELDTIDPEQFCSTCKENWYPSDMDAPNRCSEYCSSAGELYQNKMIVFPISDEERDYKLNGDLEAQKVCAIMHSDDNETRYMPDPDCRVCSSSGKCMADGTCKCDPGSTGEYCEIDCGATADGTVCSGHGRCVRNDLDMWFDPYTNKYRCECIPYDTYTAETRQRLLKRGFQVEPPPSPEHYGRFCEFHCPRYNGEICSDRGSCETGVAVATSRIVKEETTYVAGDAVFCSDDLDCKDISGAFCARLSTPWDSLMQSENSPKSFFSNGKDSPGYYSCATSDNCIDSIYSVEWDRFCVNMLNGWYPNVLNTAECSYNNEDQCRLYVEEFFMNAYNGTDTWCEAAKKKLSAPMGSDGICGDNSFADQDKYINENVPICHEYTIETTCNAQSECIYDQTLSYIVTTDRECESATECSGRCRDTGNNTCETKTYCRAKTCSDIMFENNVEELCLDLTEPCPSDYDWQNFCAESVGKVRVETTQLTSMETFFNCYMYENKDNPTLVSAAVPGGIPINGILQVYQEDIPVSEFRQSFVDSRIDVPPICNPLTFDGFCGPHLIWRAPLWYVNREISSTWFAPWIVVCNGNPIDVVATQIEAFKLSDAATGNCESYYKLPGAVETEAWSEVAETKDSIIYKGPLWKKSCLNSRDEFFDDVSYYDWTKIPSQCEWLPMKLHQRWGQSKWTPDTVIKKTNHSCQQIHKLPWIEKATPVPTLCDMQICGLGASCRVHTSSIVECSGERGIECHKQNPCRLGAHCSQKLDFLMSSTYRCDVTPPKDILVQIGSRAWNATLSNYETISFVTSQNGEPIPPKGVIKYQEFEKSYARVYEVRDGIQQVPFITHEQFDTFVPNISTLAKCEPNINWWQTCSQVPIGVPLGTAAPSGLKSYWSGDSKLISNKNMLIEDITWSSNDMQMSLRVSVIISDGLKTICDGNVQFWPGSIWLTTPFYNCRVISLGGHTLISSILVSGQETIQTFKEALSEDSRQFYFKDPALLSGSPVSDYSDWSFNADEHVRVFRESNSILPPNGTRGITWDLPDTQNIRVSGFNKFQRTSKHVSDMRVLNGDGLSVAHIYVWQNYIWLNDKRSSCKVSNFKWWHWQMDVRHLSSVQATVAGKEQLETVFDQEWDLRVKITFNDDECTFSDQKQIRTSALQVASHSKIAASFLSKSASEIECGSACRGHKDCKQWSWTAHDSHCYLHSKRCHEDPVCVHGTHTLRAFHPQKLKNFEIYTNSTGVSISWAKIRAEPIVETSIETCPIVDPETIDGRWRAIFKEEYVPFDPDITAICNSLATTHILMPGYVSGTCGEEPCEYKPHDFETCKKNVETATPYIEEPECAPLKQMNWTAYCRYRKSFDSFSGRVPFLGGVETNMSNICTSSKEVLFLGRETCPSMSHEWFKDCFSRTIPYEEHCSNDCLDHIESMLSDNGPDDRGLCEKRKEFLDISTYSNGSSTGLSPGCDCNMQNVIVTDFCLIQDAYHDNGAILVPELYNSECSTGCIDTLKESMNRSEWRAWCSDLSEGTIPGVCSKTTCECDNEEYAGVSGPLCELTCPTGISDGEEVACSGRNGQCFAQNPDEMIEEVDAQIAGGEVRNESFKGNMVPEWMKGPEPNMVGRCQCALGSGAACSIPCDRCNNGTYGHHAASQYGICDAYNGICRALPVFMRYNTKYESENYISYNTTAFESSQGLSKWQYPDRFLYESDTTLAEMGRNYILDSRGLRSGILPMPTGLPIENQKRIKTVLKVWRQLCQPPDYDSYYLDNSNSVTNGKLVQTEAEIKLLKSVSGTQWGNCRPIYISTSWYLCFFDGKMYAYDQVSRSTFSENDPGSLYVIRSGSVTPATEGLSFAIRDPETIYAFGGSRKYAKTSETFNVLYRLKVERVPWDPMDLVLISWEEIFSPGSRPEGSSNAPMWSFTGFLYLLQEDIMYRLTLPSAVNPGSWIKYDSQSPKTDPIDMIGNNAGQLYVKYDDASMYTFTPTSTQPWSEGGQDFDPSPIEISGSADNRPQECRMNITNTSVAVSGNTLLEMDQPFSELTIYLEEWSQMDVHSGSAIVERFLNTIVWRTFSDGFSWSDLNVKSRLDVVDLIERVHMHQARWSITSIMWMKSQIGTLLGLDVAVSVPLTTEPSELFLNSFRSISAAFFAQTPVTNPNKFTCSIEGDIYERSLIVSANYEEDLVEYEQEIEMDSEVIVVKVDWSASSLRVRLKQKIGANYMEWFKIGSYRTWHLIIRLEEWQYSVDPYWKPSMAELPGAFHLYVLPEASATYKMDFQTSNFLHYSASHCSLSSDDTCPGTLPYIGLACSGRGRCNIACQCVCEVAKSILQTDENALVDIDPMKSPWRGDGCEITCPGYDGYNLDSICSSRGLCQADGTCSCPQGFTGDACQFECPKLGEEICSSHGGCGTKAYELSSFQFKNDQYLDTLTATNLKRYSTSLSNFYGSCLASNFVRQNGTFGFKVKNQYPSFVEKLDAFASCQQINDNLDLDMTQEKFRIYPTGQCMGVQMTEDKYVPVVLRSPQDQFMKLKSIDVFECLATDCYINVDEDDDLTIRGLTHKLISPSFEFDIKYVHGYSTGRSIFVINGQKLWIDFIWTPHNIKITMGSDIYGYDVIIDQYASIERVKFVVELGSLRYNIFPTVLPMWSPETQSQAVWVSPRYDVKYVNIREHMSGYFFLIPSEDTGNERTLMTLEAAEYDCDMEPDCLGLIQWDDINNMEGQEGETTLYSLYTDVPHLNGWATWTLSDTSKGYLYLKKMSLVYQGRETINSKCTVVEAGLSKYPTVTYTEDYNIPIKNIDIRLAEDPETESVVIGDGYWSNCWTKMDIDTKMGCYEYARDTEKVYGFSFSESTDICLVLTGIIDNTKIKLDRFNSESRLTLFHPCEGDSTEWIT